MAGTITINEVLVGTNGITVARNLPNNVLNLDVQVTSSDWATLTGTVDFLIEVFIGGSWVVMENSPGNVLGVLVPKGNGLPHWGFGANWLGPATQIRITATPTTPVHLGLIVLVG